LLNKTSSQAAFTFTAGPLPIGSTNTDDV